VLPAPLPPEDELLSTLPEPDPDEEPEPEAAELPSPEPPPVEPEVLVSPGPVALPLVPEPPDDPPEEAPKRPGMTGTIEELELDVVVLCEDPDPDGVEDPSVPLDPPEGFADPCEVPSEDAGSTVASVCVWVRPGAVEPG